MKIFKKNFWSPKGYLAELGPFGPKFRPFGRISCRLAATALATGFQSRREGLGHGEAPLQAKSYWT